MLVLNLIYRENSCESQGVKHEMADLRSCMCLSEVCLSLYFCEWPFTHFYLMLVCRFKFRVQVCDLSASANIFIVRVFTLEL